LKIYCCCAGADPEERNIDGFTAFHISLKYGHIPIIKYFFDSYPPSDGETKAIYTMSAPNSLLNLAIDSHEPEVVWMILDGKLAEQQELADVWECISSTSGKAAFLKGCGPNITTAAKEDTYNEIRNLIMSFGAFSPPTSRKTEPANGVDHQTFSTSPSSPMPSKLTSVSTNEQALKKSNSAKPHRRKQPIQSSSNNLQNHSTSQSNRHAHQPKCGRGSGRGRGSSRGRGRGSSTSSS
jgi:Ankyrin repeats (many copies)